jgi:acid stress chaperone HdeA
MNRRGTLLIAGLAAAACLSGCSSGLVNQGGDTKCKDFMGQDDKTQTDTIAKMLKDEKGTDAANLEITGTRLSVQTFCQVAGKQDSKVSGAPHL